MKTISRAEIDALCETQQTEFKKSLSMQREALEDICAMVNSDRGAGSVIFGITPDGQVVGVEPGNLDSAQLKLADATARRFDPPLHVTIDLADCEGCSLIVVSAVRSPSVPLHEYDGRAYIREGSAKRRVGVEERNALARRRDRASHPGPWKCDGCGMVVGILHSFSYDGANMKRDYGCPCGGEFQPSG